MQPEDEVVFETEKVQESWRCWTVRLQWLLGRSFVRRAGAQTKGEKKPYHQQPHNIVFVMGWSPIYRLTSKIIHLTSTSNSDQ